MLAVYSNVNLRSIDTLKGIGLECDFPKSCISQIYVFYSEIITSLLKLSITGYLHMNLSQIMTGFHWDSSDIGLLPYRIPRTEVLPSRISPK